VPGYLNTDVPVGAVRASLQRPAVGVDPSQLNYCDQFDTNLTVEAVVFVGAQRSKLACRLLKYLDCLIN
jgi:hypothetical protein